MEDKISKKNNSKMSKNGSVGRLCLVIVAFSGHIYHNDCFFFFFFFRVEVLRPSQPIRAMSTVKFS